MNFSASCDYRGEGRVLQHSIIMQNLDKLVFQPEDTVLDVGCGSGEETKTIASKVNSVTGVDSSEEMIAVARQNNAASNITYLVGDARCVGDNPDWKEKFDKVVSFFVLHWIPFADQLRALSSILTCLKPGGEGLFITDNDYGGFDLATAANLYVKNHAKWGQFVKGYEWPLYTWNQSIPDTVQLLKTFGCTSVECDIQKAKLLMSKVQTKLLLRTTMGDLPLIPLAEHEVVLDDIWQWALSRFQDESSQRGYIQPPFKSMVIHVRK